jgi:hypothetical protein
MYWGRHAVHLGNYFKFGQNGPLSTGHHYIVHLQQSVSDNVSENRHCIITRAGFRMGDRHSIEALQWLAYISRRRNNITHALMEGRYLGYQT